MTKLEELIKELCPNGVEYVSIGSLIRRVTEKGKSDANVTQVYAVSNTLGLVKAEEYRENTIHSEDTSNYTIVRPNSIAYNPARLNIGSIALNKSNLAGLVSPMYVVFDVDTSKILPEYLELLIKSKCILGKIDAFKEEGARFRFDFNRWDWIKIPLPPIEVQSKIIAVLNKFGNYLAILQSELTARKKQYEYYRDKLLSFDGTMNGGGYCKARRIKLKEIATDFFRGSGITREQVTASGTPCVRYGEIYTTYDIWFDKCVSHANAGEIQNPKYFEHGDILFAITGESVEDIAKSTAYVGHEKCLAGGDIVVMKHQQNPKYLAYALSTYDARQQKSKGKIKSKVVHSNVPSIENIEIPLPPLDVQERIVKVLDNFDAICSDLGIGLPAEIEKRRQQYEYYRDLLLTFSERGDTILNRTEQNRTEQNRTEQNRTEQNRTEQNRTEQNR